MIASCRRYGLFVVGTVLLLLLSACQTPFFEDGSTSKTPAQLLQSSEVAMKQLKYAHFAMTSVTTVNTTGVKGAAPQAMTLNLTDTGVQAFPDQLSMDLTLGQESEKQGMAISQIVIGDKIYIKSPKGKWYLLENGEASTTGNPLAGANVGNYANLLRLAQGATLKDSGVQSLNGLNLRHVIAIFGNNVLKDLLASTGQLDSLPMQQREQFNKVIKNSKLDQPILDLWIDEATAYVHRMELKLTMTVDLSALATPASSGSATPSATMPTTTTSVKTTIDYSKFNEPVKIEAPSDAISTNDVNKIFTEK
jgi:hypothetical protein